MPASPETEQQQESRAYKRVMSLSQAAGNGRRFVVDPETAPFRDVRILKPFVLFFVACQRVLVSAWMQPR